MQIMWAGEKIMEDLESFRERIISMMKRYQAYMTMQVDEQIKKIDKADSKEDIVKIMLTLPSPEKFNEFMNEGRVEK